MIPVIYRYSPEFSLHHDGLRWYYEAPWMPLDVSYVMNVSRNGMEMMLKEKEEGQTPPSGQCYDNARRFYRDMVEEELRGDV